MGKKKSSGQHHARRGKRRRDCGEAAGAPLSQLSGFQPVCRAPTIEKRYVRRFLNERGPNGGKKIEFEIEPQSDHYNFFESSIGFDLSISKADGNAIDAANLVSTVQAPGYSMIKSIQVFMNHQSIVTQQNHHYTSYIENLVNFNYECAYKSWLQGALWAKDTAGKLDALTEPADNSANAGFKARGAHFKAGNQVEIKMKPTVFPFVMRALWPGEIRWRVEITLNEDAFVLMCANGNDAVIKVTNAYIDMECVKMVPKEHLRFVASFRGGGPQIFPFASTTVESYLLRRGTKSEKVQHSLCKPTAPALLLLALVSEKAFMGERALNGFAFKHYDLEKVGIHIDGVSYFQEDVVLDFENGRYMEMYWNLMRTLNLINRDEGCSISRWEYAKDNFIIPIDLSRNLDPCILTSSTNLVISLQFAKPLDENLRLVAYGRYANHAELAHDRDYGEGSALGVTMGHQ